MATVVLLCILFCLFCLFYFLPFLLVDLLPRFRSLFFSSFACFLFLFPPILFTLLFPSYSFPFTPFRLLGFFYFIHFILLKSFCLNLGEAKTPSPSYAAARAALLPCHARTFPASMCTAYSACCVPPTGDGTEL
jgi:hypothetical protein